MERNRRILHASLFLIFLSALVLSALTPLMADDFSYCFSMADWQRITSPAQILPSMAAHRVSINGRVIPHGLVQLLLMLPKTCFNVLNAAVMALLGLLACRCFRKNAWLLPLLALSLWCCMPAFGQVFLWLDGAVNYAWGLAVLLLFVLPYAECWLDGRRPYSALETALRLVLAFAAGSWSENGSVSILFLALCLLALCARRDRGVPWPLLAWLAAALAGFIFLMSAPATAGRGGETDLSHILYQIRYILDCSRETLLPLYLYWAAAFTLALLAGADRKRLVLSALMVLAGLGSLAAFTFAVYFTLRHLCFTVFFTLLAALTVLSALADLGRKKLPAVTAAALTVLFVFSFIPGVLDIGVVYSQSRRREAAIHEALESGEKQVQLRLYTPETWYSAAWELTDLGPDPAQWPNDNYASYYGLEAVVGVP